MVCGWREGTIWYVAGANSSVSHGRGEGNFAGKGRLAGWHLGAFIEGKAEARQTEVSRVFRLAHMRENREREEGKMQSWPPTATVPPHCCAGLWSPFQGFSEVPSNVL